MKPADVPCLIAFWRKAKDKSSLECRRLGWLMWADETMRAMSFNRVVIGKPFRNEPDLVRLLEAGGIK